MVKKIFLILTAIFFLLLLSIPACFAQNSEGECIQVNITPTKQNFLKIPILNGDTNNDSTFEEKEQFLDLDLLPNKNILSACIQKNNAARIINTSPENGLLSLLESIAQTDSITQSISGSIRGNCIFNPVTNQLIFNGNGPKEFGFDRIYPYELNISDTITLSRIQNNFFIPSDLPTALTVTPNGKYLVYLQANTSSNNLASIQSVEIKQDMTLSNSFIGQDFAKSVEAGSYLEFADSTNQAGSNIVFGVFANLEQGKNGSGNGFGIFKTNQADGTNTILAEFKKEKDKSTLPDIFNTISFGGFSGFKLVQKNSLLYLFVSYFENSSKIPDLNYLTKVAVFKISVTGERAKTATLKLLGEPVLTVFKTAPCSENNFHGISGPIEVTDHLLYIADNNKTKNENYFAVYFIDWNEINKQASDIPSNKHLLRLASIPLKTNQTPQSRNTDLIVTKNNKFAFVATSVPKEATEGKIFSYLLQSSNISCSLLNDFLAKAGICDQKEITTNIKEFTIIKPIDKVTQEDSSIIKDTKTNINNPPIILQAPSIETGRQPQLGLTQGRPPEFGALQERPPLLIQVPQKISPSTTLRTPQGVPTERFELPRISSNNKFKLPDIPQVEVVMIETIPIKKQVESSIQINISEKDLAKPDQKIIAPRIPDITLSNIPLEIAKLEKAKKDIPILTIESRGGIKGTTGGYLIDLNSTVKLKPADLKNIFYFALNKNNNTTQISGESYLTSNNKLLAKLTIPSSAPSGDLTLIVILSKKEIKKKEIISKGSLKIFDQINFQNLNTEVSSGLPKLIKVQGRVIGPSSKSGSIIRLIFEGENLASKFIKISNKIYFTAPLKTHTFLSFAEENDIEILRTRVLSKGNKMLITLRFTGGDINSRSFTISTPKGQFFSENLGIKLFTKNLVKKEIK
ncbi:MAG: hypothetical protein HYY52_05900 [Candidatus Melainabacteria bacterium]|nr:hypothetical protein [Candidatus Melainabacteria bacterium]